LRQRRILVGSLFAASIVLAGACGPDWDVLDPSLGEGGQVICPSDGNDCTVDDCSGAVPTHTPVMQGMPCSNDGGSVCNATGACVQCNVAEDCGPGDECKIPTCSGVGTCGFEFVPSTMEAAIQTDGDCQKNVCDGMGAVTIQPDPGDTPNDLTDCTVDLCVSGQPMNSPVPASEMCSEGGGKVCNGKGACVACNVAADCGMSTDCKTFTCDENKCPTDPNKKAGELCGGGRCDDGGTCVACQTPTALLFPSLPLTLVVPNNDMTGVTATMPVTINATSIIDVDVNVSIMGGTSGDLTLTLMSAAGTPIDLSSNNGGVSGNNFTGTAFDDDSNGGRITEVTFADNVNVVSAIPERNLSLLNGENPNGDWKLVVKDTGNLSSLNNAVLSSWSLTITAQNGNHPLAPPPFPDMNGVSVPANATTTRTIVVSDTPGFISKATVSINLEHKDTSQLVLTLVSPSNKVIPLSTKNGGANSFMGTIFDDAAQSLMGCSGQGCVTFNSPVVAAIPEGSLSALIGDGPNGTWMLKILDTANGGQPGMLNAWTLNLSTALCPLKP